MKKYTPQTAQRVTTGRVTWQNHYNIWFREGIYICKYEHLLYDTTKAIKKILSHLNINVKPEHIKQSIYNQSFEIKKKKLSTQRRRKYIADKMRKGKHGSYKSVLNSQTLASVRQRCGSVMAKLGYEEITMQPKLRKLNPEFLTQLAAPATLFDVGVANGTPFLYRAFPKSYLVLIEPLQKFRKSMNNILSNRAGKCIQKAVSSKPGRQEMIVYKNAEVSSFHERIIASSRRIGEVEVDVTTLDHIILEHNFPKPFGLKIDTEGHEDEVIKGAIKFLKNTAFVIAEVSIRQRHDGSYIFDEFIALMKSNGFALYDILRVTRKEGRAAIMDAVFMPS